MSGPDWRSGQLAIVVVFDEGETTEQVPFVFMAPGVSGIKISQAANQYALFLADLSQVFGIAAEKAPDAATASRFKKLADDTLVVERSLHETYGKRWKLTPQQMSRVPA